MSTDFTSTTVRVSSALTSAMSTGGHVPIAVGPNVFQLCNAYTLYVRSHSSDHLEAKIVEHHDNYRRRHACCPKQVRMTMHVVTLKKWTPNTPNRAMEVIDDLVAETREAHDLLLEERHNQYRMEEKDRAVEDGMRAELAELKGVVGVAIAAIVVLVAALLVIWSLCGCGHRGSSSTPGIGITL
ncbi:hypothetical protein Cgig2_017540 [Carnegiea gigantea]|uniref:Uncharacterized protein n=1 Tax=Carnegiea gigantea TaxID=171969 RepID=A0A9Q1JQK0_9CARY|nr:hypothetical protein Cgig2_010022 [Carnegiea gigantea]KAJ8446038.1 hypothetical protein Cgig2_017540 [Carnegiea gigantea]